jgi:hypothetical protein
VIVGVVIGVAGIVGSILGLRRARAASSVPDGVRARRPLMTLAQYRTQMTIVSILAIVLCLLFVASSIRPA